MDANGLRFWMLAERTHWTLGSAPPDVEYDAERRVLRLASTRAAADEPEPDASLAAAAGARLTRVAQTADEFGTRAWWDATNGEVRATGAVGGEVKIFTCADGQTVSDLAVGHDGVLYIAVDGNVVLHDLRDRWNRVLLRGDGDFQARRLAANADGGVWVLDRAARALWRVIGLPLPTRPFAPYSPGTARPCAENPDPPRLVAETDAKLPAGESPVAIASTPGQRLAMLTWAADGEARLRLLDDDGRLGPPTRLIGARYAYDIAWVDAATVAVLVTRLPAEALAYRVSDGAASARPLGDFYPLRDHTGDPFVNGTALPALYPVTRAGATTPTTDVAPLHALSHAALSREGTARARAPMDSGTTQTVWHRLYVEAAVPPMTGIRLFVAATNEPVAPESDDEWHEHRLGAIFGPVRGRELPQAAWVPFPSELPYHAGLLPCPRERDRAGLFTVLVQRSNRRVRTLRGRYLWVRAVLAGDGRSTPEIAAVRAYASRLSYRDRYLPELYREWETGREAERVMAPDARRTATPADFLERFIDNFEGTLTLLEDRIASAHLLTDPRTTTDDALEWLAGWLGIAFDPAYPSERRRALLAAAPALAAERGTLRGLRRALDVVTGDACSGGEIIVLEDFRLRRTFATILGVDLSREDDPLLDGITDSGNSYVGDTLFVGDEQRKEFLALFQDDMPTTRGEDAAIAAFFDALAYRVTVLVHQNVSPQSLGLVRRVVELEAPAHVQTRVVPTTRPMLVGVASLVGVDTYLTAPVGRQPVLVQQSQVGARDFLLRPPSLDPRLAGGASAVHHAALQPPTASATAPEGLYGESVTIDASASTAASRSEIERFRWTRLR